MFKSALNILTAIFACFLIIVIFMPINSNAQNAELFSFLKQKSSDAKPASSAAESEQPIDINFKVINSKAAKTFQMPLLDGKTYDVKQSNEEGFISRGEDDYTWRGKLKDAGEWTGDVILTVKGKAMSGLIFAPSGTYEIIPQKDFTHVLVKIDPSLFPYSSDDSAIPPNLNDESRTSILNDENQSFKFSTIKSKSILTPPITALADNGSQIDVLIVYTVAVRNALGGASQVQAFAQQAVATTNTAYQNSGIATRLRLVQTIEVSYADNGTARAGLEWVTDDATVAAARNSSKADVVSMITENANDDCGYAWIMTANTNGFERFAYSLVQRNCAVGNLSFAHEIGHNQGCNHNPENAVALSNLYPYGFGHWNAGSRFITIMSYFNPCPSCFRIPNFSNPSLTYNGLPIGISGERDNTRVINNTALDVSKFRESGIYNGGFCVVTALPVGQTINASLTTSDCSLEDIGRGYADFYEFRGTAGQRITVSMNSSSFDTYLYLVNSIRNPYIQDDNGGGGTNSRLPSNSGTFTLPSDGLYTIWATSSDAKKTGTYSIRLDIESDPCPSTPISVGQTVNGSLTTSDCTFVGTGRYLDVHTFSALAGQQIAVSMNSSAFNTYLYLVNSNNQTIAENDDSGGETNSRIPVNSGFFTIPTTGTYSIYATAYTSSGASSLFSGPTGNYTLTLTSNGGGNSGSHNAKTAGVFRPSNGITYLRNSNTGGFADVSFIYGVNGDTSIAGDWNGDGKDSLGIYRNGLFYLRNTNTTGPADIVFAFGSPGDQPIAGDWNGDGIDTIGLYRRSTGVFILRNSNSAGEPDAVFVLGNPNDIAIAGDWDGDGIDTTGVFRPSNGIIYLKNQNVSGFADIYLVYGNAGDKPLAGDWDGDGKDSVGIYRNGVMYLRNSNTQGVADIVFAFGNPGDEPIAGDWDGLP